MTGPRGRQYDPWVEAERLGVAVIEMRLRGDLWGEYVHRDRLIRLRRGMTRREARSVLSHEVEHARAGDSPTPFGNLHRLRERRADWSAALLLVDADEYAAAEALYGPCRASIAAELDVIPEVIDDWRRAIVRTGRSIRV